MKKIKAKYELSKSAKVGDECICPSCGSEFVKANYQQAFCKTKKGTICKDKYWNTVDPNKRNNTTRLSPTSRAFMAQKAHDSRPERIPHPADVFGPWHDDDWHEHDGGSGGV